MTERQNIEADAADSQSRPGLSGMRRFSTEDNGKGPLTMKLHDLPKPSFSIGPPGQRSVPATSGNLRRNPVERGAFTPGWFPVLAGHGGTGS